MRKYDKTLGDLAAYAPHIHMLDLFSDALHAEVAENDYYVAPSTPCENMNCTIPISEV